MRGHSLRCLPNEPGPFAQLQGNRMAVIKRIQVIDKPVEQVFETVLNVAHFPKWNPTTPSARKLSPGEIGEGSRFEVEIRGFGKVPQGLREFEANKRERLVSSHTCLIGGDGIISTTQGSGVPIDHEVEMTPKGFVKIFSPFMGMIGARNLRATANALQRYVERA